jgi:hypothetical protein
MNERIFELAKQADLIQWDTLPSGARTPDHESVVKARKFAELIVRECAENFAKVWYEQGLDIRGAELDKFMKRFDEHFGVQE